MAFLKRTKIGEKTYVYIVCNAYNQGKSDQIILARLGIEKDLKDCFGMDFKELQEKLRANQNEDFYARLEATYIDFRIRKKAQRRARREEEAKARASASGGEDGAGSRKDAMSREAS